VDRLVEGEVMMFENIRWYAGEKKDIDGFGKYLASFGDFFVNDGFGVSHREDASVVGIAKYLPSVAGLLLADEIKYMELTVNRKQARPFVAVI
jgi:3-phosphoglycerate kinase